MPLPLATPRTEIMFSVPPLEIESDPLTRADARSFRYDPPSWARTWDDPKITLPTDAEFRDELRAYQAQITDPELILFAVPTEEEGASNQVASRLSTVFGIATAAAAILYFFGHVIAAWAMGRLG